MTSRRKGGTLQSLVTILCTVVLLPGDTLAYSSSRSQAPSSSPQNQAAKISSEQLDSLAAPIALWERPVLVAYEQECAVPTLGINRNAFLFAGLRSFDANAGRQELLYRRIGANELDAIGICHGYVEAQHDYALKPREGYDVSQYVQRIISTPGKQDGLAWQSPHGSWGGPIGEKIAAAIEQGYTSRADPYHGYFFKILKGLREGFGTKALEEFEKMERFNPDKSWSPVAMQVE